MAQPLTWFEICSTNHDKLRHFYTELFDWSITPLPGMDYAIIDTARSPGGGLTGPTTNGNAVVIYVEVDDLDACLARAEELGGRVVVPVTEIPDMVTFAQFADPEGNTLGLVKATPTADVEQPPAKYVLFYDSSEAACDLAPIHFPAHSARVEEFHARGELLLVGTFADPMADGSMSVFTSREAAERFVDGDPFRTEGVIKSWQIKEWHESYLR
jgi:predicted enzyme related to lactoylglutathione lyase/uncharacterized protein YciI